MTERPASGGPGSNVLFAEAGASWWWLLAGPAAGLAMLLIQLNSGLGLRWTLPVAFCVLVSGFLALQIKAARIHTSVELTGDALRQGTETIPVADIARIYPEPSVALRPYSRGLLKPNNALANRALRRAGIDEADFAEEAEAAPQDPEAATVAKWQAARALGELTGVPRGRTGFGMELTGGRTVQAWARRHRELRAALTPLVERRRGPQPGGST